MKEHTRQKFDGTFPFGKTPFIAAPSSQVVWPLVGSVGLAVVSNGAIVYDVAARRVREVVGIEQEPGLELVGRIAAHVGVTGYDSADMKEIAEDESLRKSGTVVEVDHPTRGKYLTVGNPIRLSGSETEITRSPLLGEHTDEILRAVLGYSDAECLKISESGAIGAVQKIAAE